MKWVCESLDFSWFCTALVCVALDWVDGMYVCIFMHVCVWLLVFVVLNETDRQGKQSTCRNGIYVHEYVWYVCLHTCIHTSVHKHVHTICWLCRALILSPTFWVLEWLLATIPSSYRATFAQFGRIQGFFSQNLVKRTQNVGEELMFVYSVSATEKIDYQEFVYPSSWESEKSFCVYVLFLIFSTLLIIRYVYLCVCMCACTSAKDVCSRLWEEQSVHILVLVQSPSFLLFLF